MPLDEFVRRVLGECAARVRHACPREVLEMRVFGSRARGDAREDSDLDVFVKVTDDEERWRALILRVAHDLALDMELASSVEPLVMARAHFDDLLASERRIALDITAEGILI